MLAVNNLIVDLMQCLDTITQVFFLKEAFTVIKSFIEVLLFAPHFIYATIYSMGTQLNYRPVM